MSKGKDPRDIAVKIIMTFALLVTMGCIVNIYMRLASMHSLPVAETGSSGLKLDAEIPFNPFEFFSGSIEVNGMPVEWKPDADYDGFIADLVSKGWKPVEADWKAVRAVSQSDSVMLQKGGAVCFVMALPGHEHGLLTTTMVQGATPSAFQKNPWESEVDARGADLVSVPRPSDAVRVFSLLFGNGAGAVCYRFVQEDPAGAIAGFRRALKSEGWKKVLGGDELGLGWYAKGASQCCFFVSENSGVDGKLATVLFSQGMD
jgi:hypothetical protein